MREPIHDLAGNPKTTYLESKISSKYGNNIEARHGILKKIIGKASNKHGKEFSLRSLVADKFDVDLFDAGVITRLNNQNIPKLKKDVLKGRIIDRGHDLNSLSEKDREIVRRLVATPKNPLTGKYDLVRNPYTMSDIVTAGRSLNNDAKTTINQFIGRASGTNNDPSIMYNFDLKTFQAALKNTPALKGTKNITDVIDSDFYAFLKKHNFKEDPKALKPALQFMGRLPQAENNINLVDKGISAGIDFKNAHKQFKGTPGQVKSKYLDTIAQMSKDTNFKAFAKDFPEHLSKAQEKSITLAPGLVSHRGTDVSSFKGGKSCFGDVCISTPYHGSQYGLGKSYGDATLNNKAEILSYQDPKSDFKALAFFDKKTKKIKEIHGPSNSDLDIKTEQYKNYKKMMEGLGYGGL